jgi:ATP-dependent DNA helicase RecG
VSIFKDRVEIVNPGGLPAGLTRKDLGKRSLPRNPLLFSILYRMGLVEQIGSGIRRIQNLCQEYKILPAQINCDENWFSLSLKRNLESGLESKMGIKIIRVLENVDLGRKNLSEKLGYKSISGALNREIKTLLKENFIAYTLPDKPNSRLQKYHLTEKGKNTLKHL